MASISKMFHCRIPFKKFPLSSNKTMQKTTSFLKRHFMTNFSQRGWIKENLHHAFILIAEERAFSEICLQKAEDPQVMSYEEFLETIETYEEFLLYPQVKKKLEKSPHLDSHQMYKSSCILRYESHKIFFYTCKLLWKKTETTLQLSSEIETLYPECSALIKAMDLTGISYFPHF